MKQMKKQNKMDLGLLQIDREHEQMLITAISQQRIDEVNRITKEKKRLLKKLYREGMIHILIP